MQQNFTEMNHTHRKQNFTPNLRSLQMFSEFLGIALKLFQFLLICLFCSFTSHLMMTIRIFTCAAASYGLTSICLLLQTSIPAVCSSQGSLLAVVPGVLGLMVFSPELDACGNPWRAVHFCQVVQNMTMIFFNISCKFSGKVRTKTQTLD